jgi:5-methylcytosine-specific restriction endonuclease McrA
MSKHSLKHLSDDAVDQGFHFAVRRHSASTADLLSWLAEFDHRRRYLPAGYGSMWDYCRQKLQWSRDVTKQRIQAAKTAREHPEIFTLLAEGRLELCGIRLLAPHLTGENAEALLAKAVDRSKRELADALRPEMAGAPVDRNPRNSQQNAGAPGHLDAGTAFRLESPESAPVAPAAPGAVLHLVIDQEGEDLLRHTQALLSHTPGYRDVAKIFNRALKALRRELETKRFGSSVTKPRRKDGSRNPRYIPADVRQRVLQRDGFSCRHKGPDGHVCGSTYRLELDHRVPIALGGESTEANVEVVCRAHNQFRAEQELGKRRMEDARALARERRAARKPVQAPPPPVPANAEHLADIECVFTTYKVCKSEARRLAADVCASLAPGSSLEDCAKAALRTFAPPGMRKAVTVA